MWTDKYLGIPYATTNCGELVKKVLAEEFQFLADIPTGKGKSSVTQELQIRRSLGELCRVTHAPRDGDVVLMRQYGRTGHVGIFARISNIPWVLHTTEKSGSVLQPVYQLDLVVEDYYTWR